MCDSVTENETAKQIKLIRKFLKLRILEDNTTFRNHTEERNHVYDLMKRTVSHGESHSALIIGPRGSGKTTLINSVLNQLSNEVDLENDAIVVKLNGLIHSDEKTAIKAITAQMQLENAVGDRVFGTFAENLSFLLDCINTAGSKNRSVLVLLEQMDMFCKSGRTQATLYNLFDITHTGRASMCVLGITNRLDVMELLEKRVKSRFSHRHILVFPATCSQQLFVDLLRVPVRKGSVRRRRRSSVRSQSQEDIEIPNSIYKRSHTDTHTFDGILPSFAEDWNSHICALGQEDSVIDAIEKFNYYTNNEQIFRNVLFQLVSKLNMNAPFIDSSDFVSIIDNTTAPEHIIKLLHSLSILELSLVIAMKHGMDIFDGQPMNFEMVLHRYTKFANTNSSSQTVPRPVILKAFEHLQALEIIMPVRNTDSIYNTSETTASRVQKEYKLYTLAVPVEDINEAVKTFKALPTEINHWYNNSVV